MPKICQKGKKRKKNLTPRWPSLWEYVGMKGKWMYRSFGGDSKSIFWKKNWKIIKKWLDLGDFLAFLANFFFNFLTKNHGRETENAKYFTRLTFGEAIAGVVTKEFGLVYPGYPKYADMAV